MEWGTLLLSLGCFIVIVQLISQKIQITIEIKVRSVKFYCKVAMK